MPYEFNSVLFAQNSQPDSFVYSSDFYRNEISVVRRMYPEIAMWEDHAIRRAWAGYSRDIFTVRWVKTYWLRESDNGILAYIYLVSTTPNFDFTTVPERDAFLWSIGEIRPWLRDITLSSWKRHALAA